MAQERKTSVFLYGPIDDKLRPLKRRYSLKLIQNAALLMFTEASPNLREAYFERVDAVLATGELPQPGPKAKAELFRAEVDHLLRMT